MMFRFRDLKKTSSPLLLPLLVYPSACPALRPHSQLVLPLHVPLLSVSFGRGGWLRHLLSVTEFSKLPVNCHHFLITAVFLVYMLALLR